MATSNVVVKISGEDNNIYARSAFCRGIPEVVVAKALRTTTSNPGGTLQRKVKCRRRKRMEDDDN